MTQTQNSKKYDLEERTLLFAKEVKLFVKTLPKSISNFEYAKQIIRSSASVGANYIEANESMSKKDFVMRVKICRKEAKETIYWLNLIDTDKPILEKEKGGLITEATELMMILGSILKKVTC